MNFATSFDLPLMADYSRQTQDMDYKDPSARRSLFLAMTT
jgi:hypothetical protein